MKVKGIILAGGKSSRFGQDKALACINGITMLERAVNLLKATSLDPVVITNQTRDYSFCNCLVERDIIPDKGPLGGIYTACRLFGSHALLALTCDMPGLTPPLLQKLIENHDEEHQATVFRGPNCRIQPFPGIYKSDLAASIFEEIQGGRLSMDGFLKRIPKVKMFEAAFPPEMFSNINEKKDLCQKS